MRAKLSSGTNLRVLLVLGRVSNLPTVWSNCLAAWLLGGSGPLSSFALLCGGATLLYTGGMFLNDAFDVEFDRRYRPERPIISGQITHLRVWLLGASSLSLGLLAMIPLGKMPSLFGGLLLAAIVLYDAIHKRTVLAPVLIAGCRFLLYWLSASAACGQVSSLVMERAAALAAYIIGLSYLARGESRHVGPIRWATPLLFIPITIALLAGGAGRITVWLAAVAQGAWVIWCLRGRPRARGYITSGVSGLLAGIALVDLLATVGQSTTVVGIFALLFVLALLSQRVAPAT
jgi:hypothetical protein